MRPSYRRRRALRGQVAREAVDPAHDRAGRRGHRRSGRPASPLVSSVETKPQVVQPKLLFDLTSLQREANSRFGFSATPHALDRAGPLRPAQAADVSADQLPLSVRGHGRPAQAGGPGRRGGRARIRRRGAVRARPRQASAQAGRRRQEGHRPPRDHPDRRRPRPRRALARRAPHLTTWWPGAFSRCFIRRQSTSARSSRPSARATCSAAADG